MSGRKRRQGHAQRCHDRGPVAVDTQRREPGASGRTSWRRRYRSGLKEEPVFTRRRGICSFSHSVYAHFLLPPLGLPLSEPVLGT